MENIEELTAEELTDVAGGQTTNPDGANWQAVGAEMGTAFIYRNMLWYRLKFGDTLWQVSQQYGTTVSQIRSWNPATTDPTKVLQAGAALIVRTKLTAEDRAKYPDYRF